MKIKKILMWILLMVCLLGFTGVMVSGLKRQDPEITEDPVQGISAESSFKGYLGKGYAYAGLESDNEETENMADMPAQTLEESEEKEQEQTDVKQTETVTDGEKIQEETQKADENTGNEEEVTPNTIQYNGEEQGDDGQNQAQIPQQDDDRNQDGAEVPGNDEPAPTPSENKYPSVATDLTNGETVNASYRTFYVQAFDYNNNVLPSSALEVMGNGEKLYSAGTDAQGIVAFRLDLQEGANTVTIRATDEDGWSMTLPEYTIYKGQDENPQPAGSITISIEAGTVGLGTLLAPEQAEFYQGEQLSSILLRVLEENGFDWRNNGEVTGGFYLRSIGRSGLTAGAAIPEDLLEHLQAVNSQLTDHDNDWLGEFDFTMDSGWLYFVNGEYMNIGMSSYFPADGDEVRLRFSLYAGADVGAGQYGETWGDW